MKDCYQLIVENIRKLRKAKGLTQERLAEKVGISATHLNKFENGQRQLSMTTYLNILQELSAATLLITCPANIEHMEEIFQEFAVLINDCSGKEIQFLLKTMGNIKNNIKEVS